MVTRLGTYQQVKGSPMKIPCIAVTTENITLTGGTPSTVDGITVSVGDRILVKEQSTPEENGIYVVSVSGESGTWDESIDTSSDTDIFLGFAVFIYSGDTFQNKTFYLSNTNPRTFTILEGNKVLGIQVFDGASTITSGNGKAYFRVPLEFDGRTLIDADASIITKGSTETVVMVTRGRQTGTTTDDFTYVHMLTTGITIDANEYDSKDSATPIGIDTENDEITTGDLIRIDVDTAGTGSKGLNITLIL